MQQYTFGSPNNASIAAISQQNASQFQQMPSPTSTLYATSQPPDSHRFSTGPLGYNLHHQASRKLSPAQFPHIDHLVRCLSHTIIPGSRWIITIKYEGHFGFNGQLLTQDYATGSRIPGTLPRHAFLCQTSEDARQKDVYRLASWSMGDLTPEQIINFIQQCMAYPQIPNVPCIPNEMQLSAEVLPFSYHLSTFFSTFPSNFTWKIESSEESHSKLAAARVHQFEAEMKKAQARKNDGEAAYKAGERLEAVDAFHEAGSYVKDILNQDLNEKEEATAKRFLAICYANRAAVWLMPGDGMNLNRCVEDAQKAESVDPSYKKSYIRQARGYQSLGEFDKAMETIARALSQKELLNDEELANCLIVIQTGGRGLSRDKEEFEEWKRKVLSGDVASAKYMKGMPTSGAWYKKVEDHSASIV